MPDDRPPSLAWHMWKRFLLAGLTVIVLTAVATTTFVVETVGQVAKNLASGSPRITSPALTADEAGTAQTILVIGSDKRAKSSSIQDRTTPPHTDTILLVRMDPQAGQTSILSIPRDLLVNFTDARGGFYPNAKINSAYSYGGASLALKVIKQTLGGITINHVVDFNFQSFRHVVDAIGCVYVDVDTRYFNQNVGTIATDYASINIQPGYQRLCGQPALDYARYRHTDSDFVRVARQQDFIRQVKEQVGVQGLINNYGQISSAVGRAIATDIRGTTDVLRLLKLAAFSLGRPVRQVKFAANPNVLIAGGSYVVATPEQIRATVREFLHGNEHVSLLARVARPAAGQPRSRRRAPSPATSPGTLGLTAIAYSDRAQTGRSLRGTPFTIYLPRLKTGVAIPTDARRYAVRDEHNKVHFGYRVDWRQTGLGGYYGVEGMNWTNPPLFANARTQQMGGRSYLFVDDGAHIHDVGWRQNGVLYWFSNTLLEDLTNAQMLAIAQSARATR
jgi:polyisoprenyl-teichoic acid--peptidoglycan teichoic acid transferase